MPNIPAGAKRPTDHNVPRSEPGSETQTATRFTHNGLDYIVTDSAFDDVELMELVADMNAGNFYLMPQVVQKVLGKEQYSAFKEANRDESGIVRSESLKDLFQAANEAVGESRASR